MKIAVVGGCGSGKTTIANELKKLGFDAYVVGQEHSSITELWKRQNPDVLVVLDASLEIVRERRGAHWPEWLFNVQCRRLQNARESADIRVSTSARTIPETVDEIVRRLPDRSPGTVRG